MRARALTADLDRIAVQIVGVDDLIRMKQATGRPSDIEDIEAITAVAQRERSDLAADAESSERPSADD
jgi:hypothetical protein